MTLVMKFGGTSVGSADAMRKTVDLILQAQKEWGQVAVIASGMGSKPVKVTDLLLNGAHGAAAGDGDLYLTNADKMRAVHAEAIDGLLVDEKEAVSAEIETFITRYTDLCQAVNVLGELSPRALDAIGGMGEQMSIRVVAAYLRQIGHDAEAIDATRLIRTDSNFLNASPDFPVTIEQTQAIVQPILDRGAIPIITGFIGSDENGVTTTLGRGGSDYSASIIGRALNAKEVWIWTDVDGVMSADPRLVKSARSIPELTYREVSELAYYGARVLHPKTMRPVVENNIPLRIKNTFNPAHAGTVIVQSREIDGVPIEAVTAIKALALMTVEGKGMMGIPGIAARTFGAVAKASVSILLISQASSEQSICFALPADSAESVQNALEEEFAEEIKCRDIDRVWCLEPVAIVTVVGAGMRGTPGIAGRVFSQLGENGVNIIAIAQGSSECSISLVIEEKDSAEAISLLHKIIVS